MTKDFGYRDCPPEVNQLINDGWNFVFAAMEQTDAPVESIQWLIDRLEKIKMKKRAQIPKGEESK